MRNQPNLTHIRFVVRYFAYTHLPEPLQKISKPFRELADLLISQFELKGVDATEMEAALRKLKEAKDCAVSSFLPDKL